MQYKIECVCDLKKKKSFLKFDCLDDLYTETASTKTILSVHTEKVQNAPTQITLN